MIMGEGDNGAFPFTLPFLTSKNHYCAFQTDSSPFCESSLTYEWCFTGKQYYINFKRNVRCNRHGNDSQTFPAHRRLCCVSLSVSVERRATAAIINCNYLLLNWDKTLVTVINPSIEIYILSSHTMTLEVMHWPPAPLYTIFFIHLRNIEESQTFPVSMRCRNTSPCIYDFQSWLLSSGSIRLLHVDWQDLGKIIIFLPCYLLCTGSPI